MDEKTILFNGGQDHDVEPIQGADPLLVRLLGAAPSRPAVPTLRAVQDPEGRQSVGVFIGSAHVGYLRPLDEELLATVKACELNGAVARARGNLIASWDSPGMVKVKVSLADSERLLCDPEPEGQDHPAVTPSPSAEGPEGAGFAAPETSEIFPAIESSVALALAAGLPEDYPDWPPPGPKPLAPPKEAAPQPVPAFEEPLPDVTPGQKAPSTPSGGPTQADVSAQALLSTRGAWMGSSGTTPRQASQTGWLNSAARTDQAASLGTITTSTLGGALSGLKDSTNAGAEGTTVSTETRSWQDMPAHATGASGSPDEEIIAAWNSSPATARPVPMVAPAKMPGVSATARTWILSALAVVVLVAAAFLVWKFMFAPQTYTDAEYHYSFSYPGNWDTAGEGDMSVGALPNLAGVIEFLGASAAGYGNDQADDFAAVGVFLWDLKVSLGVADLQTNWEMGFTQATQQSGATFAMVEPVAPVTQRGLDGFEAVARVTSGTSSLDIAFRFFLDGTRMYELVAMTPTSQWQDNSKAFDSFFKSFRPGP